MLEQEKFLEGKTTVFLDLDGTLVRSVEAHAKSWQELFKEHQHDLNQRDLERLIGMGGGKLIENAIGETDPDKVEMLKSRRSAIFHGKYLHDVYPVRKNHALINALRDRGLQVMLATASSADDRDALLERGELGNHFHEFIDPGEVDGSKPEPDLLQALIAHLNVEPSHCVMVGDSPFDSMAATAAGVDFVGVESGCYTRQELPNAVRVFPSVTEFAETLEPATEGSALG